MNTQSQILENISNNFRKLFINCNDVITFVPPTFSTSEDITALIILNQIIDIMYKKEKESNIQNEIVGAVLEQIIVIKCNEYCNENAHVFMHKNTNNIVNNITHSNTDFINSFYNYVKLIATTIVNNYSAMKIN